MTPSSMDEAQVSQVEALSWSGMVIWEVSPVLVRRTAAFCAEAAKRAAQSKRIRVNLFICECFYY